MRYFNRVYTLKLLWLLWRLLGASMGRWSATVILGPSSAVPRVHSGPDGVPPEVLMPDNPWEACQHVLTGQLSIRPVCKRSLFLGKDLACDTAQWFSLRPTAWPLLRLCHAYRMGSGRTWENPCTGVCSGKECPSGTLGPALTSRGRFHHKITSR